MIRPAPILAILAILLSGMASWLRTMQTHREQELFPGKGVFLYTYDDREAGGPSRAVSLERHSGGATLVFSIGSRAYSWVGMGGSIGMSSAPGKRGIDLTGWDDIEFDLSTNRPMGIQFVLIGHDAKIWRDGDYLSRRASETKMVMTKSSPHRIPISSFQLADWWIQRGLVPSIDTARSFDQVVNFEVKFLYEAPNPAPGQDTLILHRIRLVSSQPLAGFWIWSLPSLGWLGLAAYMFWKHRIRTLARVASPRAPNSTVPNPRDLGDEKLALRDKLTSFLAANYHREELDADTTCREAAIPRQKLPEIVREMNSTFKELLNDMRLGEASRLLRETENPVSEIAFAVGYGSIPHFNRVFRERFGCAPLAYQASNRASD